MAARLVEEWSEGDMTADAFSVMTHTLLGKVKFARGH